MNYHEFDLTQDDVNVLQAGSEIWEMLYETDEDMRSAVLNDDPELLAQIMFAYGFLAHFQSIKDTQ